MAKDNQSKNETNTISTKPIKETKTLTISQNSIIITLIVIILIILAFIGGTIYQKNSRSNSLLNLAGQTNLNHHGRRSHIFKAGTITNVSSNSITINSLNSGSLTFSINSNTKFKSRTQSSLNASDLKNGQNVLIKPSSSSSSQAQLIILKD